MEYILGELKSGLVESEDGVAEVMANRIKLGQWSPGTCKVYLNFLKKYISYLKTPWVAAVSEEEHSKLTILENCMTSWSKSLGKLGTQQESTLEEEIINPDDVQAYFASDRAKQARTLLSSDCSEMVTQLETI